jgi:hypothetical protein
VPSDDMLRFLKTRYSDQKDKIVLLPHFFDPAEILVKPKVIHSKVRFVMYGNIYETIDHYIDKTIELFSRYPDEITLDIYTDKLFHSERFRNAGLTNVKFFPQLNPKLLFDRFENYDYVLLLNPAYNKNNISTKFYEIIYSRTPIVMLGDYGLGAEFVVSNNLGIFADLATADFEFEKIVKGQSQLKYNYDFNVDNYTLRNVTLQIIKILSLRNI